MGPGLAWLLGLSQAMHITTDRNDVCNRSCHHHDLLSFSSSRAASHSTSPPVHVQQFNSIMAFLHLCYQAYMYLDIYICLAWLGLVCIYIPLLGKGAPKSLKPHYIVLPAKSVSHPAFLHQVQYSHYLVAFFTP